MSTEIQNPFAIFQTNIEDIKSFDEVEGGNRIDFSKIFYEPTPDEDGKKPYIAAIKFLPNIYNPLDPVVQKSFYKLTHPDTGKRLYWDSPSSIGEACIVMNEFFRLRNEKDDARSQNLAKQYARTRQACAVIQIIKDPQNPELDGQFRLFRMQLDGDVHKAIKSKIKPTKEEMELDPDLKGYDVFNPFGSPTYRLKVLQTANGRDFSGSTWHDTFVGMQLPELDKEGNEVVKDGKTVYKQITAEDATNTEVQNRIVEALKADHINIKEHFAYKPADANRVELVKRAIKKMSNAPVDLAPSAESAPDQNAAKPEETKQETPTETKPTETAPEVTKPTSDDAKSDVFDELGI
ncbi:gp173 [Sphingomonas phage PAU]|uniref:gp173 n=1 Tax=Sphingomonas phage PAU TaxID=1150991 RepID=UPI00025732F9|nr:gp173 [Sphingomonas phage PAU]AFF28171.1 gp173 [Sphingomonas phage PAU]